jgi:hypothetical protein
VLKVNAMSERHHFAIVAKRTKQGRRIEYALEYPSRGEADIASLRLIRQHGPDAVDAVTVERRLAVRDVLPGR